MKLPSMQFYPGDWRKDPGVQALDYESRGIWFEILMIMFESKERGKLVLNGQPMPDTALATYLGLDVAKVQQTLSKLVSYGVANIDACGVISNRRMVNDENLRKVRAAAGHEGGKQKASKTLANAKQKSTPSSSSSSSSSSSTTNIGESLPIEAWFSALWELYPRKDGRKSALKHFKAAIGNAAGYENCRKALDNYVRHIRINKTEPRFIKNGATWFNNWDDWVNWQEPARPKVFLKELA